MTSLKSNTLFAAVISEVLQPSIVISLGTVISGASASSVVIVTGISKVQPFASVTVII